ncbi:hypothetical protein HanRHA438_Chr07g0299301 [Helianthus annuus]|nr:hypothetical protein HanRHA438_Chr07g0299301 [Helianthus annuus]
MNSILNFIQKHSYSTIPHSSSFIFVLNTQIKDSGSNIFHCQWMSLSQKINQRFQTTGFPN